MNQWNFIRNLLILSVTSCYGSMILGCHLDHPDKTHHDQFNQQTSENDQPGDAPNGENEELAYNHTDPNPPRLNEDDLYEIELRSHVINLDDLDLFSDPVIRPKSACSGEVYEDSESHLSRFGPTCFEVRVPYRATSTHTIEEADWVFSATHRVMGQVTRISTAIPGKLTLNVRVGELDDIFERVRIRGLLSETLDESLTEQFQGPLSVHRQELRVAGSRSFNHEQSVEYNFGFRRNPAVAQASIEISGDVRIDAFFGYGVPDEEEFLEVEMEAESLARGQLEFSSTYNNVARTSSPAITFKQPLQLGWLYTELIFEAKIVASADFNTSVSTHLNWSAQQHVHSDNHWSREMGWQSETEAESEPFNVEFAMESGGKASLSLGVELNSSIVVYKILGTQVAVTPTLEATAKGAVQGLLNTQNQNRADFEGCLQLTGAVDIEVTGIVRGLDDFEIYKTQILESTIASTGECEEDAYQDLPIEQAPPIEGFQFSLSGENDGRCDDFYSVLGERSLRIKADSCNENPRCILSFTPCDARFPGRKKRGVCSILDGTADFTYYDDHYECPDSTMPAPNGFAPCSLTRQQEWGDARWAPSC